MVTRKDNYKGDYEVWEVSCKSILSGKGRKSISAQEYKVKFYDVTSDTGVQLSGFLSFCFTLGLFDLLVY